MIQFLSASVMAIGSVVGFVGLELATSLLHSGYSLQPLEIVSVHEEHVNIHVAILFRTQRCSLQEIQAINLNNVDLQFTENALRAKSLNIGRDVSEEDVQQVLPKMLEGTIVSVPDNRAWKHPCGDTSQVYWIYYRMVM
ncbi:hypothetical protein KY290_016128 [Solanum tuberosum]|uniref:Uncharacterized protein n=1 Tax=Solanum tuberosum TaxID=4113 RepID=A0ABQ7VUF4_SOLTU|nr:hypothetical protein KY290_016128 [Solanum tuberosum]